VRVSPGLVPYLSLVFEERIHEPLAQADPPDADGPALDGWITLTLSFERLEVARECILGLGRAVEVLEPEALRQSVADFAAQIVALYAR
jgi:predicted DNA-binding transcriptional regulator YafY